MGSNYELLMTLRKRVQNKLQKLDNEHATNTTINEVFKIKKMCKKYCNIIGGNRSKKEGLVKTCG